MGKVRKRKGHGPKSQSVVEHTEEEEITLDTKDNVVQTMIDQISSANVEEKYCGIQTFATHIEDPETLQNIISRDLIKIVAPHIIDAASSVRNAAAGALRNVSALKFDLCDTLMENDVMTPLICFFHQYAETWVPDTTSKTNVEDIDTFVQCVNLLLNLCESSDLAIKYLGESRILDIFPRYLDLPTFGVEIVKAVMQCLYVVLEDNPKAIEKIRSSSENQLKMLLMLEDPEHLLIKTLAAGVTINLYGGKIDALPVDLMNKVISILAESLSIDHRSSCHQLSSSIPVGDGKDKIPSVKGKEAQILDSKIKSLLQLIDAHQCAIEIVANLCSSEESDDTVDMESSDSEEMQDDEVLSNGDSGSLLPEDKLSPHVLEAFVSMDVFSKIWSKTQLPAENVMLIFSEYEGSQLIYKKLLTLQTKALLCINNILSTLPIENLGGVDGVYKVWVDAGKLVFKQNSKDMNLMESATAVMRAALDKIKFSKSGVTQSKLFQDMELSDIELMLIGIRDCQVAEIRSNLIRMIGILALLLVNNLNEATSNVICMITEFLIEQAHKESEVWVLAEAIDTIVDLYSEDETNELAAKIKLPEKLAGLAPILRNKARQQKKLPKEYKVLVNTANSNLPRFIKYMRETVSKL
ncbi:HEAT repeat-containing protein 3 [Aricia agestis]|uniref:HEAT repeat-containing protein 3 n=1 Tax=Aricia agestis TaxID=91739 RepID=UPI001C203704|nr:HEAT repeat-containing protein 3 [Aricia agestis]